MAAVAVHDKQAALGLGRPRLRLERPLYLLECMAAGRPTTVTRSEVLVV